MAHLKGRRLGRSGRRSIKSRMSSVRFGRTRRVSSPRLTAARSRLRRRGRAVIDRPRGR